MSRRTRLLSACVFALVVLCYSVRESAAVEEPHDAPVAAAHGEDAQAGGAAHADAPPSILSGDLGNVVWTLAIFIALLLTLRSLAWKPILGALQRREQFIHESLDGARRERQEAETLLAQYKEQLDKARGEATAIVEEGKRDAEVVRRRVEEETRRESDAMIDRARREIDLARDAAVKELFERTIALSTDVAGRIIGRELTTDDHRSLLDQSIQDMARMD